MFFVNWWKGLEAILKLMLVYFLLLLMTVVFWQTFLIDFSVYFYAIWSAIFCSAGIMLAEESKEKEGLKDFIIMLGKYYFMIFIIVIIMIFLFNANSTDVKIVFVSGAIGMIIGLALEVTNKGFKNVIIRY